jgi:uncharacterized cupin superfamily protein
MGRPRMSSVADRQEDCHAQDRHRRRAGTQRLGLSAAIRRTLCRTRAAAAGQRRRLTDFGVNLMRLPPGNWSSQRHWHSDEDEFVYVLEGELTLIEDGGETVLRAGDCAAFPKNSGNGHHLINKSGAMAVYLEVGARSPADVTICSDIDMMSSNADGRFVHKDGTPYPES